MAVIEFEGNESYWNEWKNELINHWIYNHILYIYTFFLNPFVLLDLQVSYLAGTQWFTSTKTQGTSPISALHKNCPLPHTTSPGITKPLALTTLHSPHPPLPTWSQMPRQLAAMRAWQTPFPERQQPQGQTRVLPQPLRIIAQLETRARREAAILLRSCRARRRCRFERGKGCHRCASLRTSSSTWSSAWPRGSTASSPSPAGSCTTDSALASLASFPCTSFFFFFLLFFVAPWT